MLTKILTIKELKTYICRLLQYIDIHSFNKIMNSKKKNKFNQLSITEV